jgi:hypothetical protein
MTASELCSRDTDHNTSPISTEEMTPLLQEFEDVCMKAYFEELATLLKIISQDGGFQSVRIRPHEAS